MTRYRCNCDLAQTFVVAVVALNYPTRATMLIGRWSLDEDTGIVAVDASGTGLTNKLFGPVIRCTRLNRLAMIPKSSGRDKNT